VTSFVGRRYVDVVDPATLVHVQDVLPAGHGVVGVHVTGIFAYDDPSIGVAVVSRAFLDMGEQS